MEHVTANSIIYYVDCRQPETKGRHEQTVQILHSIKIRQQQNKHIKEYTTLCLSYETAMDTLCSMLVSLIIRTVGWIKEKNCR